MYILYNMCDTKDELENKHGEYAILLNLKLAGISQYQVSMNFCKTFLCVFHQMNPAKSLLKYTELKTFWPDISSLELNCIFQKDLKDCEHSCQLHTVLNILFLLYLWCHSLK